jgi:hypothetical protein
MLHLLQLPQLIIILNIQFSYFETAVKEKELIFHYQLKKGVSQDRLGYLILEREGVVDLLKNISKNKY